MSTSASDSSAQKPLLLRQGKYVFIDNLKEEETNGSSIPYFSATAIIISEKDGLSSGELTKVNLSDLILKQSSYVDENGKMMEAHKLYVWPRNLGSTKEWTMAKQEFLNQYVMNFPVEILSLQQEKGVTWRYITPENFKDFPEDIQASSSFKEYLDHKEEYFFLRRPIHVPK